MVKMKYYGLMVQIPFDRYDQTAVNRITVGTISSLSQTTLMLSCVALWPRRETFISILLLNNNK